MNSELQNEIQTYQKDKEYKTYKKWAKKLKKEEEDDFVNFGEIPLCIGIFSSDKRTEYYFKKDVPIFILLDKNSTKMIIIQEETRIAYFYTTWEYYYSMYSFVKNPQESLDFCRMKLTPNFEVSRETGFANWYLTITIYIKPDVIQKMYNYESIPDLLNNLIFEF